MNVTEAPGSDNSRQTMRKPGDVYLRCNLDIDSYQGNREPQQRGAAIHAGLVCIMGANRTTLLANHL